MWKSFCQWDIQRRRNINMIGGGGWRKRLQSSRRPRVKVKIWGAKAPIAPPVPPPLEIMLLFKWIKVEKFVLPSSSTCAYSSLSKKDLDNTNKEVKHALEVGENRKVMLRCALRMRSWSVGRQIKNLPILSGDWFATFNACQIFLLYGLYSCYVKLVKLHKVVGTDHLFGL